MEALIAARARTAHHRCSILSLAIGVLSIFCLPSAVIAADAELLQVTTVDSEALTFANGSQTQYGNYVNGMTYQQYPLRTYKGYQYTIYFDKDRHVAVGRRKLPAGNWDVIHFPDYTFTKNDTHNVATLGICENDGTIHLAFDHHNSPLHYRVSVVGAASNPDSVVWTPSLFGSVTNVLGPIGAVNGITYPRFISMPNGNLMIYYRVGGSGNGDSHIRVYNGNTHAWLADRGKFIAQDMGTYTFGSTTSTTRNAYLNGIAYGGSRLHVSWCWRENGNASSNHDLCYAYSDDDGLTWKNSTGTQIGVAGTSFINLNSTGLIVSSIPTGNNLINQNTQYVYPNGEVHAILPYNPAGQTSRKYFHHWRDSAGNWASEQLSYGGGRPELLGDGERNLFVVYTGSGKLNILRGVPNAGLTAWTWSRVYQQAAPSVGAEGQVDPTRWASERVISSYGQEIPATIASYGSGTPFDGLPTPLHITDIQASSEAAQPDPAHQAAYIPVSKTLAWTPGLDAISHRVYLGTDANAVAAANTSSPEYKGEQTASTYTPSTPLTGSTTYYWRIDEVETGGIVRTGLLWSYSTDPPAISTIANQFIQMNSQSGAIAFTVAGGTSLTVSKASSNTLLIPAANIVLAGSGSQRTVTITPAVNQTGTANITLTASDGSQSSESVFTVTVTDETYYWDQNGTASGFGAATGTWGTDARISISSAGTATPAINPTMTTAATLNLGTSTDGLATGSIGVNGTRNVGTIIRGSASGAITFSSGTINLGSNGTITNNGGGQTLLFSGATLAGSGTFVKNGSGQLQFNSVALSHTGSMQIDAGTVLTGTPSFYDTLSKVILNGSSAVLRFNVSSGTPTFSRPIDLAANGGTLSKGGANAMTISGAFDSTGTGERTLTLLHTESSATSGVITLSSNLSDSAGGGALAVRKTSNGNTGTWLLTGNNTHTGSTAITAGILGFNATALQNSFIETTASIAGDASNGLRLTDGTVFNLGGLGGNKDFSALFTSTTGGYNTTGLLTLNVAYANDLSYSGQISGTRGLTKTGSGSQTLTGTNTYTGATLVSEGTLVLGGGSTTSAITVSADASLGFAIGSPVVTSTKSVNLTNGTVIITGTPTLASYTLITATDGFIGTPTLYPPGIPGYELVVDGTALKLNFTGAGIPYYDWATGGELFNDDANNDGVSNGLAFLLGADNPFENATARLPTVTRTGGNLVVTFQMRDSSTRGDATLSIEHSHDLGLSDPWTSVAVPESDAGSTNGVTFVVSGSDMLDVTATISSSEAEGTGSLFCRLKATE